MLDFMGCEYKGKCGVFEVIQYSKVVLIGKKVNDLYIVRRVEMLNEAYTITEIVLTEVDQWHKRLSNISSKGMQTLSRQGILPQGINEHCVIGKATRHNFTKAQHTTKGILDYVHSSLWEANFNS